MTTINYDVIGVSSNFDFGNITDNSGTSHARFLLNDGEASGSFTESGASSGDSYKLFIEKTNTNLTDTVTATSTTPSSPFAVFHHGTFANGGDPYSHGSVTAAATAGYFYSDTATGTYELGTLDETPTFVQEIASESGTGTTIRDGDGKGKTTYKFTFPELTSVDHLLVAGGGGGGGGGMGGGGGAGGYLETTGTTISAGQKTIVVGGGGVGGHEEGSYQNRGRNGADTSVTGFTTAIGGGGGASDYNQNHMPAGNGGSGGGGSGGRASNGSYGGERGTGTVGQGFDGARSGQTWWPSGGGGGASEKGYGRDGSGSGGNTAIGHGGNGKQSTITGFTSYWFAGGGGSAGHDSSGGNGGKGGGGGGARHGNGSHGTGNTDGLTNGENGDDGTPTNAQEPPANTAGGAGGKHTGGGGGGGDHHSYNWGGVGGSGIVIIRTGGNITTGKTIPKLTGISNVTSTFNKTINYTFNTQGTGTDKVTYKIGSGSEVTTASGVYTLAYTPADFGTTTMTHAYTVDSSGNQLGTKFGPYSVTTTGGTPIPGVKRWKHIPPQSNGTTTNWAYLDTWIPVMHTYGTPTPTIVSTSAVESGDNFWYIYTGWIESSSTRTYALTCNADDDFYFWSGDTALDENRSSLTYSNAVCYKRYVNSPSGQSGGNLSLTGNVKVPIRMMFGELTGGENWSLNFDSVAVHSNLISTTVGSDTIKFVTV